MHVFAGRALRTHNYELTLYFEAVFHRFFSFPCFFSFFYLLGLTVIYNVPQTSCVGLVVSQSRITFQ